MKTLVDFGTINKPYSGSWEDTKKDDRWYGINKGKSKRNKRNKCK